MKGSTTIVLVCLSLLILAIPVQAQVWTDDFNDGDISDWTFTGDPGMLVTANSTEARSAPWCVANSGVDSGAAQMSQVVGTAPGVSGTNGLVLVVFMKTAGSIDAGDVFEMGYRLSSGDAWIIRQEGHNRNTSYEQFLFPIVGTPSSSFEIRFGFSDTAADEIFYIDDVMLVEKPVLSSLLFDNFDDGDASDWTFETTGDEMLGLLNNATIAYSDGWCITNQAGGNDGEGTMRRVVGPVPAGQGVRIGWALRQDVPDPVDSTDFIDVSYRLNASSPWVTVFERFDEMIEASDNGPGVWAPFWVEVPVGSADFEIRFRTDDTADDEIYYIDDVSVDAVAGVTGLVTRSIPKSVFLPRETLTVRLTAIPQAGGEIVVTETVPTGLTPANIAVSNGTFGVAGQDVTWTVTPATGGDTLTYEVTPPLGGPSQYVIVGTHTAGATWPDQVIGGDDTLAMMGGVPFEALKINFQGGIPPGDAADPTPAGYMPDDGSAYATRNGWNYGWFDRFTGQPRDNYETRNRDDPGSPDERYDSLNHMMKSNDTDPSAAWESWEIEIPNGTYNVFMAGGDPDNEDQAEDLQVEGISIVVAATGQVPEATWSPTTTDGDGAWAEGTGVVTVADGRLTITNGPTAQNNKIQFIDITPDPPLALPVKPTLTVTDVGSNYISLSWTDAGQEMAYELERREGASGLPVTVAILPADSIFHTDQRLNTDTTYFYRVRGYNTLGDGPWSDEVNATTSLSALDARNWHLYD